MIADTNNIVNLFGDSITNMVSGDFVLFGILFFIIIALAMIYGKVRASVVVMVGFVGIFIFSLLSGSFVPVLWIILIVVGFVLLMGLRRWLTSP